MDIYSNAENSDQNLLYELYPFNFIFPNNSRWIPNTFVGDIDIRALIYYINNILQWKKPQSLYSTL